MRTIQTCHNAIITVSRCHTGVYVCASANEGKRVRRRDRGRT